MSAFDAGGPVAFCRARKRRPEDMAPPVFSPRHEQIPLGILYMVGSTLAFAGVNALVKWEVALYPVGEVAFVRSLFSLIPCYLLTLPRLGFAVLRTERRFDHVKRALSQFCSMMSIFLAFQLMPLAGAIAISFSAPLFTTLLSILILKERVGVHRWSALLVGFIGVLCVTRPGAGMLQSGAIFALSNAVLTSTVAIAIRRMSVTESIETLTFYLGTLGLSPYGSARLANGLAEIGQKVARVRVRAKSAPALRRAAAHPSTKAPDACERMLRDFVILFRSMRGCIFVTVSECKWSVSGRYRCGTGLSGGVQIFFGGVHGGVREWSADATSLKILEEMTVLHSTALHFFEVGRRSLHSTIFFPMISVG